MKYFYSFMQKMIEYRYRKNKGINIYMFHQVNQDRKNWLDSHVCITEESFKKFIYGLKKANTRFLSVKDLGRVKNNLENVPSAVLTFDDIFEDAYKYAFPILKENNIPYCVFITENYIDKKGYITTQELNNLLEEPLCTIGYHSKNHILMRKLSNEKISDEIECCEFEEKIGKKISYFAFPYGSVYACSKKSIKIAKDKNYKLIFSTVSVPCTQLWIEKGKSFIPRINVNEENYEKLLERIRL
nr:polysaccharide deacetylase family protein [uncultured Sellimonas sp.]